MSGKSSSTWTINIPWPQFTWLIFCSGVDSDYHFHWRRWFWLLLTLLTSLSWNYLGLRGQVKREAWLHSVIRWHWTTITSRASALIDNQRSTTFILDTQPYQRVKLVPWPQHHVPTHLVHERSQCHLASAHTPSLLLPGHEKIATFHKQKSIYSTMWSP